MWKPRLGEHKALAKGHTAGNWWAQETNPHQLIPHPSALCAGEAYRAGTLMEGEGTQATGGQIKREHSALLEKGYKLL